jgi:hypothetical protein
MTPTIPNPRQILMDLSRELGGDQLETVVSYKSFTFKMCLLNEEESNWRNGFINMGTKLSTVTSWRLPTLAIGIREINSVPVPEFFRPEWEATEATRQALAVIEGKGKYTLKYFAAEYLMQFLSQFPPEPLEDLYAEYQKLEARREEASVAIKKSSGESSEKATKSSGTELSPSGEDSSADSK